MNRILIFFILTTLVTSLYSQVESPPTLALGVASVVGEKGSIDVDVLAEIISAKQAELKREFVKTVIFKDLSKTNYTSWEYMYNTINVLLESESKEAIKKNLLKNSANLALVYGFAEFYLQLSSRMGNSDLHRLVIEFDQDIKIFEYPRVSTNVDLELLLASLNDKSKDDVSFTSLFIDLTYDVLRSNRELKDELGFLDGAFPLGKGFYESQSAYYRLKEGELKSPIDSLKARMAGEVRILFSNYILLKKLKRADKTIDSLVADYKTIIDMMARSAGPAVITADTVGSIYQFLTQKADTIYKSLEQINPGLNSAFRASGAGANTAIAITESVTTGQTFVNELSRVLTSFNQFRIKGGNFSQNDIYYLENTVHPLLVKLVSTAGLDAEYVELANQFDQLITYQLLREFQTNLSQSTELTHLLNIKIADFGELLDFITRLDQLDKVETYEFVLKTIQNTGELFQDKKLTLYLTTITDNLEKYTIINVEENKVEVSVEDIISRLYDRYSDRQSTMLSLYFSVGVNQAFGSKYRFPVSTLLPDSSGFDVDTASLNSLTYVSEKIGFKLKLWDFKKRNAYEIGETTERWGLFGKEKEVDKFRSREPFVSDLYFIGYGSGILYKVANLTTDSEFTDPIWGIGLGVAFFNSLDLNVSYSKPFRSDNDFFSDAKGDHLFTVGFDVKITEYIQAVGKKRKKAE